MDEDEAGFIKVDNVDEEAEVDKEGNDGMADDGVTITASPEKADKGPAEEPTSMFNMDKTETSKTEEKDASGAKQAADTPDPVKKYS